MNKIEFNLKKIMVAYSLPKQIIAEVLYPKNKYPLIALKALEDAPQRATVQQLADLSNFLGVSLMDIIEVDGMLPAEEQEVTTFKMDGYWVYFNHENKVLKVQKIGSSVPLFNDNYIIDEKVGVSSFLKTVREIIDNF